MSEKIDWKLDYKEIATSLRSQKPKQQVIEEQEPAASTSCCNDGTDWTGKIIFWSVVVVVGFLVVRYIFR